MRICFVSHGSGRGGAEEVLLETLECLKESGVDCRVLMPGDRGLGEDLRRLGIPYQEVPYWCWMGHKTILDRLQVAARNVLLSVPASLELRKWNPDIIYSNTVTTCFGAILAGILRRPHVWHMHELGYEDHGLTFDFGSKLSYKIINSASALIAVSKVTADAFSRYVDPRKITVMFQSVHRKSYWLPIDTTQIANEAVPNTMHKLRCIIVGRLSEGKRQEEALLAIARLKQVGIDAELLIIGRSNPRYTEKLQGLIESHKLSDRVCLVGSVRDRLPFVQSAHIVLMCSRCEAFGRVTVEGMLAGKPVIAADTGANPEFIRDGFNGLLYKAGDIEDLAAKIRYLYENKLEAKRIGENGKSQAESFFNKERFAKEIIPFLRSVAENDGQSIPHFKTASPLC
jgi:glycosyltransferase involved in cell wall biosynthesis